MRLRGIVEMEFYLQQFEITDELRNKFIKGAKQILKAANIIAPSLEPISHLYDYVCNFAKDNNCSIKLCKGTGVEKTQVFEELDDINPRDSQAQPSFQSQTEYGKLAARITVCGLSVILVALLVDFLLRKNASIMIRALSTTFSSSKIAGADVNDKTIREFIGLTGSLAIHDSYGRDRA